MKIVKSLKSLKNRKDCHLVSRKRGGKKRVFLINKINKKFKAKQSLKIHQILMANPFDMIGIDTIGPFQKTSDGNRYIILATDYATNWSEGITCKRKSAKMVVRFLLSIFHRHGAPREIRSDMGGEFTANVVKDLAEEWGSKMRFTASYSPFSNGKAERTNYTLVNKLCKLIEHDDEWDRILDKALFCYRITPSEKSKMSPFELLYYRKPYLGTDEQKNDKNENRIIEGRETMDDLILQRNNRYREYIKKKIKEGHQS